MKSRTRIKALGIGVAALSSFGVAGSGIASAADQACVKATNVEAIVDDSGSMSRNDPNALRSEGLKLLIDKSTNRSLRLGAVEFGSDSRVIFKPLSLKKRTNRQRMKALLSLGIQNNGALKGKSTNYNAGFTEAKTSNPKADARIFLTDGKHNVGTYEDGHEGGPRTYVVALGDSVKTKDAERLQKIADDTGGLLLYADEDNDLQPAFNIIDAALDCIDVDPGDLANNNSQESTPTTPSTPSTPSTNPSTPSTPSTPTDPGTQNPSNGNGATSEPVQTPQNKLDNTKKTATETVAIPQGAKSIDLVISWTNPNNQFSIRTLKYYNDANKTIKIRKKYVKGKTYLIAHISSTTKKPLPAGHIEFTIKPVKLAQPEPVQTQLTIYQ